MDNDTHWKISKRFVGGILKFLFLLAIIYGIVQVNTWHMEKHHLFRAQAGNAAWNMLASGEKPYSDSGHSVIVLTVIQEIQWKCGFNKMEKEDHETYYQLAGCSRR
jgi:hypothetical protein